jgi:dnd system-associated protein 4
MRRIQRDISCDGVIQTLTTGEGAIFKEIWRLMLFASSVGIAYGKRKPLQNVDSGKNIPDSYFSSPGWLGFLHLLGITETGGSETLHWAEEDQEIVASAFEEYAYGGLEIIADKINEASSPLDAILLILAESQERPVGPAVISGLF